MMLTMIAFAAVFGGQETSGADGAPEGRYRIPAGCPWPGGADRPRPDLDRHRLAATRRTGKRQPCRALILIF